MTADNRKVWQDLLFADGFEGIPEKALAEWQDIRTLPPEQAKAIISANYWNATRCNDLFGGLDVMVADFALNSGPRHAVKILQRILGFEGDDVDGFLGAMTLIAAGKREPVELIEHYHEVRMRFLHGEEGWEANKIRWSNHCDRIRAVALQLAPKQSPSVVAKQDNRNRNIAAWTATAATLLSTSLPTLLASLPDAKQAYAQVDEALSPTILAGLPWLIPALGIVAMIGVLFLKVRASTMATNAEEAGSAAPIVAGKVS